LGVQFAKGTRQLGLGVGQPRGRLPASGPLAFQLLFQLAPLVGKVGEKALLRCLLKNREKYVCTGCGGAYGTGSRLGETQNFISKIRNWSNFRNTKFETPKTRNFLINSLIGTVL
jgi:hypothetical protein